MAQKTKKIIMLEYRASLVFIALLSIMPYRLTICLSRFVGFCVHYLAPKARNIAMINLYHAFPKETNKWRAKIARRAMQNLLTTFVEFIRSSTMTDSQILKRIKIEGRHLLDDMLSRGKGIICITGHIGNWEYMAFSLGILGYHPHVLTRSLENPILNNLIEQWRIKRGEHIIERRGDLRSIFEALKKNCPVGFLCDQNFSEGVFVDLFGVKAKTASGAIAMAIKTGAPITIVYTKPYKRGYHKIVFSDEFLIEPKKTKKETIIHNTARYTKCLERIIMENPELWFWAHKRFNSRPNGEPEIFYDKVSSR